MPPSFPNYRITSILKNTHVPLGPWRAPSHSQNVFFIWREVVTGEDDPKLPSTARNKADVHGQAEHSLARALPEKNESGGIPLRARIGFKNRTGRQASMRWGSRIQRIYVSG
jgi:hypothetical protein